MEEVGATTAVDSPGLKKYTQAYFLHANNTERGRYNEKDVSALKKKEEEQTRFP